MHMRQVQVTGSTAERQTSQGRGAGTSGASDKVDHQIDIETNLVETQPRHSSGNRIVDSDLAMRIPLADQAVFVVVVDGSVLVGLVLVVTVGV